LVGQKAEPKRRPTRANRIVPARDLAAPGQQKPPISTGQFDEMPQWCADFVEAFDTLVERGPTTGDIALAILNDLD
jgi:hypothetical protein